MVAISEKVFCKKLDDYLKEVRSGAETVFVTGEHEEDETVVVVSQERYNLLLKAENNLEFLTNLEISRQQLEEGKVITKTMEELKEMADG